MTSTYKFSFTATSLRTRDLVLIANWENNNHLDELELAIGNGKSATGKRIYAELKKWIEVLTDEQISILKSASFKAQNEIAFLAVCKYYNFIREFVIEVVREKYLVFDYELTEGDYLSFVRRKSDTNSEFEKLTEKTQYKIKQVCFKILAQANLINNTKSKIIQPQLLEAETQQAVLNDNPEFMKFFLLADIDINRLSSEYV